MKKYDLMIGNPPYDRSLHLKIIEAAIKHLTDGGKACYIHPNSWFTNPYKYILKNNYKLKFFKKYISYIDYYNILNKEEFNNLFNTNNFFGVGIFIYSKIKVNKYNEDIFFENIDNIYYKLITLQPKGIYSKYKYKKENISKYFTFIKRTNHSCSTWIGGNSTQGIFFNSKNELDNFINSFNCWPYKYMNYCGNEYCTYQPYMDDYNEPWTNERFYDFFKITDNEKKLIQERIKTIYWKNT